MLESLFNKVASLKTCNFIEKDSNTGVFLWILTKFLRTPILKTICERLLFSYIYPTHFMLKVSFSTRRFLMFLGAIEGGESKQYSYWFTELTILETKWNCKLIFTKSLCSLEQLLVVTRKYIFTPPLNTWKISKTTLFLFQEVIQIADHFPVCR